MFFFGGGGVREFNVGGMGSVSRTPLGGYSCQGLRLKAWGLPCAYPIQSSYKGKSS